MVKKSANSTVWKLTFQIAQNPCNFFLNFKIIFKINHFIGQIKTSDHRFESQTLIDALCRINNYVNFYRTRHIVVVWGLTPWVSDGYNAFIFRVQTWYTCSRKTAGEQRINCIA
jgi:hypothetical protein